MSTNIYREKDGDLSILKGKVVEMIGYGNQGRSQALNMRDQGIKVIVGNRNDEYKKRAVKDGFEAYSISKSAKKADALFFLIPDEIMSDIFERHIKPFMKKHDSIVFASGYNIAFGLINPPDFIDVLLIAPRMIGIGVRECFLNKEGYFTFIGVHQDASGEAKQKMLALSKAVGGLTKVGIEVTFMQETVLDLFTEQGFGPAFSQIMMKPVSILTDAGYSEEAILVELILSGKMKFAFNAILENGIINQTEFLDARSQYGAMSRGLRLLNPIGRILSIQKDVLKNIENGGFADEWEKKTTKLKFKLIKFMSSKVGFAKIEKRVRKSLGMPEVNLWAETRYPTEEDIEKSKQIKAELDQFKNLKEF